MRRSGTRLEGFPQQFATRSEQDAIKDTAQRLEKDSISREIYDANMANMRETLNQKLERQVFESTLQEWVTWRRQVEQRLACEHRSASGDLEDVHVGDSRCRRCRVRHRRHPVLQLRRTHMRPNDEQGNLIQRRPAETVTAAGGAAIVIAYFLGIDEPGVVLALTALVAVVPAAITFLVVTLRK